MNKTDRGNSTFYLTIDSSPHLTSLNFVNLRMKILRIKECRSLSHIAATNSTVEYSISILKTKLNDLDTLIKLYRNSTIETTLKFGLHLQENDFNDLMDEKWILKTPERQHFYAYLRSRAL